MRAPTLAFLAAVAVAVALGVVASDAHSSTRDNGLRTALVASLRSPDLSLGRTGAYAVDLRTGAVLFAHNSTASLLPASNEKLPVAWAALRLLGPSFRFRTEVVGDGLRSGPSWTGDLVLKGYGDPTLSSVDIDALARTIQQRGIREVTGHIRGDESYFDSRRGAPGWKTGFVGIETPPLSALVVDRGRGWPKAEPALLAARALKVALELRGVEVRGIAARGIAPVEGPRLAVDTSPPLSEIASAMNTHSDNFTAELVLKQLGAGDGHVGSTARGARIVLDTMRAAGIPTAGVRLADGSGLSRDDRLTPQTLVALLRVALADPRIGTVFFRSLAAADRAGTLDNRLSALGLRLRAKTGTTNLASSLSGVIGGSIAFAVLQNGDPLPYWAARSAQDRFVTTLARLPNAR